MSKGSTPRPFSVKDDVFSEAYCRTFGHKLRGERCMNCGAKPEGSPTKVEVGNGHGCEPDPQGQGQAEGLA